MRYHKRCLLILELVETAETEVLQQRLEMPMLGQARQPLVHFGHKVHC